MNKTFLNLRIRTLFSCMALSVLVMACAPPAPTVKIVNTPTQVSKPVSIQTQPETPPIPPAVTQPSSLVFPHISGDAGNFSLLAGETLTFTWENAPTGADKYEFVLVPLHKEPTFLLGIDFDDSDGVAVSWTIPEHLAAELHATAYFPNAQKIDLSFPPLIYSGDFPPAEVCSLIARNHPVEVYRLPDRTAEKFALLYPSAYAHVLEVAPNGWYRIDASAAELFTPSRGILPGTGFHVVAVSAAMNSDLSPASGDGWVNSDQGVLLTGTCPP